MANSLQSLRRTMWVKPGEIGSRRVSADQIVELFQLFLSEGFRLIRHCEAWCFRSNDRLECSVPDLPELVRRYDLRRIRAEFTTDQTPTTRVTVNLNASYHDTNEYWVFEIAGAHDAVLDSRTKILDHVSSWSPTKNGWAHPGKAWLLIAAMTSSVVAWQWGLFVAFWSFLMLLLLFAWVNDFAGVAGYLNPYIWIFRPEGAVQQRTGILWKCTFGLVGALVLGVAANLAYAHIFSK